MIGCYESYGYEGIMVDVSASICAGPHTTYVTGIEDSAVKTYRDTVKAAILDCGFDYPEGGVTVTMSPCDVRKDHTRYELAGALAILAVHHGLNVSNIMALGSLNKNGIVFPTLSTYAGLISARDAGFKYAIVSDQEADVDVEGITVVKVENLREAFECLQRILKEQVESEVAEEEVEVKEDCVSFENNTGTHNLDEWDNVDFKYAMAIAAAARLNMLVIGSPGCGKSPMTMCMQEITPDLMTSEKSSCERIYSIAGLNRGHRRPFRFPHQTASIEGICGGGMNCRPGEISLAHNGALFLDEAAEFRSSVLQMLRVPLENHTISLSRAGRTTVYPADFQLLMATNPCPCGNYGVKNRICLCSYQSISNYWRKFSAPLLDRMDIRYAMGITSVVPPSDFDSSVEGIRKLVKKAWEAQLKRQGKLNRDLSIAETTGILCTPDRITSDALTLIEREGTRYGFSIRARASVVKIAQTVADMRGLDQIDADCIRIGVELRKVADTLPPEL